jgi:hypothetical protein
MTTKTMALIALLAIGAGAVAAEEPEAVYAKMHAAALARDLDAMRLYAAESLRPVLVVPDMPKTYRIIGKAMRKDGAAAELRASGTADSVGLGYTQMFGVIGLVKEKGDWKVDRLSWSIERPGEYPEGYVAVAGPVPEPRSNAEPQVPRFKPPPSAPEASHIYNPRRASDAKPEEKPASIERSPKPCVIKPVMTDDDLRACGARIAE